MHRPRSSGHAALRGKTVVITGASSGIGRAAALQFAAEGCRLVLAARREASLREVAALCEALGSPAPAVRRSPCRTLRRHPAIDPLSRTKHLPYR